MDFTQLAAYAAFLGAVGLDEAAIKTWIANDEAAHPDRTEVEERFKTWIAGQLNAENVTRAALAAAADVAKLFSAGKGPIERETDGTSFG